MPICLGVDKQGWTFESVYMTLRQVLFHYKVKSGSLVSPTFLIMWLSGLVKKASRQTPAGNEYGGGTCRGHIIKQATCVSTFSWLTHHGRTECQKKKFSVT